MTRQSASAQGQMRASCCQASARPAGGAKLNLAIAPTLLLLLLPKCPLCAAAYVGALSSLGALRWTNVVWRLLLMIAGLAVGLFALAFRARSRRGVAPFALGAGAGAALVVARFVLDWPLLVYASGVVLAGSAVWNAWPVARAAAAPTARRSYPCAG